MKRNIFLLAFFIPVCIHAQEINIIPRPARVQVQTGSFEITPETLLVADEKDADLLSYFNEYLLSYYGYKLPVTFNSKEKGIRLENTNGSQNLQNGKYFLNVSKRGVLIQGDKEGLYRGITSLLQLFPVDKNMKVTLNYCTIEDYPRFAYRGMHLDVARHFFPVSFIKKYLDYLALHKFNYFHWHLTDDQGWRIEIKKYPNLTINGSWRNGTIIGRYPDTGNDEIRYGGFYTQAEIKEVVKYAAARFITVVPEIEMPGHTSAAIASYPELSCFPEEPTKIPANMISATSTIQQMIGAKKLVQETWGVFEDVFCAGKENTFKFLQDVMDEVLELFPSKYIHIGGDECPKTNWKRCPNCQKRIIDEKLKDEYELQSYFIRRMEKYLNSKGRTLIGWDEILEGGLAPNAMVMSWRGEQGGIDAAKENHNVIMTPGGWCYFDHSQSQNEDSVTIGGFTTVEKVYSYEPVPKELAADKTKYILGAQGNVWTEYMKNSSKVEYMIFPRMSALSEVLWSSRESRDSITNGWNDFENRLLLQFKRYDLWKANYSKAYFDLKISILPTEDNNGVYVKSVSNYKTDSVTLMEVMGRLGSGESKPITGKGEATRKITKSGKSISYKESGNMSKSSVTLDFRFNKATGKKITLTDAPSKNYPGDGAFTLVNGMQNDRGLSRSGEFLGFLGTDCKAIIDLGKKDSIHNVVVHLLNQESSWIWRPQYVEVLSSLDGQNFKPIKMTDVFILSGRNNGTMKIQFNPKSARYIKVVVKNWGKIPEGNPGAGNKAWLFVDEIEIN